ncbi:hypothetical protein LCGC14_1951140 [marine sediment metagenome]|uniref:Uncharacterized protein n=1 Tax=marine sediment metagenome TaxID=412755 RepID=A0A0F9IEH2_9ZZZZ
MIITHLKVEHPVSEITAAVREPDQDWEYERSDGKKVLWLKNGIYWHIPYLVKQARPAEPEFSGHEQTNEGEIEEYWIDPTNGEEVEPAYKVKDTLMRMAGIPEIECTAWLTADEKAWITPKDPIPRTQDYKRTVSVWFMGGKILLCGVWAGHVIELRDDLAHIELHVDKVEPVE